MAIRSVSLSFYAHGSVYFLLLVNGSEICDFVNSLSFREHGSDTYELCEIAEYVIFWNKTTDKSPNVLLILVSYFGRAAVLESQNTASETPHCTIT
jgi:hypothetical protein